MLHAKFVSLMVVLGFIAGGVLSPASGRAEVYTFVVEKQEKKAQNRWSLSEWLETRDRMRLMDLWLALHSPSPYEFYLGGNYQFNESTAGSGSAAGRFNAWNLHAAAYASIFGLEAQRDQTPSATKWHGLFHLRIFGYHAQATNITLQTGLRSVSAGGASAYRNALAGVSMSLYIMKYFGLEGLYRHYFDSTPVAGGVISGNRYKGGAFIDFRFVRVYGAYFAETTDVGGVETATTTGVQVGTRLYF